MKSKNPRKVTVFLDGVDWQYEVGSASDGNTIYPDIECLKEYGPCWEGCGIVECEIVFKKWVVEHNWEVMSKTSKRYSAKELEENRDILKLEAAIKHLEYLEEKFSKQKHKVVELKANLKKGKK
jgi:hypothetical protein